MQAAETQGQKLNNKHSTAVNASNKDSTA